MRNTPAVRSQVKIMGTAIMTTIAIMTITLTTGILILAMTHSKIRRISMTMPQGMAARIITIRCMVTMTTMVRLMAAMTITIRWAAVSTTSTLTIGKAITYSGTHVIIVGYGGQFLL